MTPEPDSGATHELRVSINPPDKFFRAGVDERRELLAHIAASGLDGVLFADHVSFRGGSGMDALTLMAGLSQLHPTLEVALAVFVLPLRHPVPVARSLSTLAQLAPGRIVFGVGIGGEDRHEIAVCGVDPRTRGRRCDEQLAILRPLLAGETVTFHGEFYDIDEALILPAPNPPIPVIIGGRSDAALRRAGRFGDGWLATWCSAARFRQAVALINDTAHGAGRDNVVWQHGYQTWVGLGSDHRSAKAHVKAAMEAFYRIGFEAFERYTPSGTPANVAEFLAPFVEAGVRRFHLTPCTARAEEATELAGEVKRCLARQLGLQMV